MCLGTGWIISRLQSRRKNDTAPVMELFFPWTCLQIPSSWFWSVWLRCSFLHGSESSSGFCLFSHINIEIVMVCLKLNAKWIKSSAKTKRINRSFLSNLIWYFFTNSALTIRKSTIKQQSQVQTIQVTVITRNVTQDNGNINNFWKDSRLFFHQFLITFCYFLRPNQ